MSGQDSPPQAPRRKKKLVLRKIAVEGGGSVPDAWSSSYTGPLPTVRPPPRLSSPMIIAEPAIDAEPEIISEMAIESTVIVAPSPDAWAAAAMTAAAPSSIAVPPTARSSYFTAMAEAPAPARPSDGASRTTVAPVVATLAPMEMAEPLPSFARARFSLDSKVLAAGGAAAAAMLLIALGVVLGVHSGHSAETTTPTAQASAPVVVEARAAGSIPAAPLAAVDMPPAAPAVTTTETVEAKPAAMEQAPAEIMATVDISQLPTAAPARGRWMPAATRTAGATGWTVAAAALTPRTVAAPAPQAPGTTVAAQPDPGAEATPAVEIPAAPPPAVDPLVQAVREDIREDEAARTK